MSKTFKKVDESNEGTNQMNMSEKSREHTTPKLIEYALATLINE